MVALIDANARGVWIISATPFADNGDLDLESTDRMVDYYLGCGVDGLTILGIMGENTRLSQEESIRFTARVVKRVAGRVPVVVGVSAPGHRLAGDLTRAAMDLGAGGIMLSPPLGLRTEDQVIGYYDSFVGEIGQAVPIVLQDYPPASQVWMSVATINRVIADHSSIVVFKHEDCPGLRKLTRLRADEAAGLRRRVSVLTANGGLYLMQEMRRGADGCMTGFGVPEMLVEVCRLFHAGDVEAAEDLFDAYLPLVRHEQQPGFGLAVRKELLRRNGVIATARTRAPGPALDATDRAELDTLLARLARRLAEMGRTLPTAAQ
ncbi:4-hydroxy-tetrahydrodipicolinate synthase [Stella humosa]|uniref:4-hydroxy-tetrahydrodipicolinate synthase n=1 Tax=Stella humosa TaxID=94 RepID=A0A3N1M1Q9_9PROT|nr:dihydrodipicolinate synthase family protein [Stella humosa]ROQ01454.1 4-hydroxy-tetrahydrodipicolinate synthase [Stella humosa]BBK31831.1 dihydrodipicolinate synthase family protein [Stella humosa]